MSKENRNFPDALALSSAGDGSKAAEKPFSARGSYCCLGRRRTRKERASGTNAAIRAMVSYASWRLIRSRGAPVALNQSEMATFFRHPKPGMMPGPSLKTITRHWKAFCSEMNTKGYRIVRTHDYGVNHKGSRRNGAEKQSKLCWIGYSVSWERAGKSMLFFTPRRGGSSRRAARGLRSRWLRDESRKLIEPPTRNEGHYVKFALASDSLPVREQEEPEKQSAHGALGHPAAGQTQSPPLPKPQKQTWRVPERVLRALWGIGRRYLKGNASALVHRAVRLWRAGMHAGQLLNAVRSAASWATDVRKGDCGRVAASVLAAKLMHPDKPLYRPPTNEEFNAWIEHNTDQWRSAAAKRAQAFRQKQDADFAASLGISVEEMRRRVRESFSGCSLL